MYFIDSVAFYISENVFGILNAGGICLNDVASCLGILLAEFNLTGRDT